MRPRCKAAFATRTAAYLLPLLPAFAFALQAAAQGTPAVAAMVTLVEGQAEVVPAGSAAPVPARVGTRVEPGSTVRTKATGRLELQFDDRSLLRLDHNTEIQVLGSQQRGVMVTLGNIWAKVQSVFGASKFQVKTPTVVAGVRGTIVRAEVTQDEAEIAVDEGEVEVAPAEGDPPVVVRANERVRAPRGMRQLKPNPFDPAARQKWEFWTDPLVQQEVQGIREAAAASQEACAEVHRRSQEIHQALLMDGQAAWRLAQRVKGANDSVASVQVALAPRSQAAPRKLVYLPALRPKLNAAEAAYAECSPLVARGREAMQQHIADAEGLREALAAQQEAGQRLAQELRGFRDRREADPHWQAFRGHCEESETYRDRITTELSECKPLLSREVPPDLGDDPAKLKGIQQQFAWGLKMLDALDKQIADGQPEIIRLRRLVGALPDAPPKPMPPPRRPGRPR